MLATTTTTKKKKTSVMQDKECNSTVLSMLYSYWNAPHSSSQNLHWGGFWVPTMTLFLQSTQSTSSRLLARLARYMK